MHRFFIPPENIGEHEVIFPENIVRQMRNVLRIQTGELVIVLDNLGCQYKVTMDELSVKQVRGKILEKYPAMSEPKTRLHLYFSLTQREKVEWILQKCTELGAVVFTPFVCARSLAQEKGMDASKARRWEKIIQEAAEQCGRGRIPTLDDVVTLAQALKVIVVKTELALVAWEGERQVNLKDVIKSLKPRIRTRKALSVFIGPEGGFTDNEMDAFRKAGVQSFSLGERILKMETAAMAVCGLILYELEE